MKRLALVRAGFPSVNVPGSVLAMKLRISGSNVRFRMPPAEVAAWRATGCCAAEVQLGPGPEDRWSYRLTLNAGADWSVVLEAGRLTVSVPLAKVQAWADAESAFTLEHATPWDTRIVVEKDLPRRTDRGPRSNLATGI